MHHEIPIFVSWYPDPVLIGSLITFAVCYALAVGPLRSRLAPGLPFPRRRAFAFYMGLVSIYLLEGSPLHDYAERYLFSAHMLQHLGLTYLSATLMIWGTPEWVWRPMLLNRLIKPIARIILHPIIAALIFNIALALWHFPAIYNAGLENSTVHHFQHIVFLFLSFIAWWPVMSPLKEIPSLPYGMRLIYLFTTSTALQLPLFAIITFSDHAFYETYINAPRILPHLIPSPLDDQRLAGITMKTLAMFVYSVPMILTFYKWYRQASDPKAYLKQMQQRALADYSDAKGT
jgi:putative membrane protein